MDIKDLKQAVNLLVELTQNEDIKEFVENELSTWNFIILNNCLDVTTINELFHKLNKDIFQEERDNIKTEALHWIVFHEIHDVCMMCITEKFLEEDKSFYEKSTMLSTTNVSAEQFGADENYNIPLSAAIVELSILDTYKSPCEKMNCLCSTFDLLFAEIKTAIVSVISQNSEREGEIPVIDNRDITPVLMVVIIKSKLVHIFSNLFYIKSFFYKIHENRVLSEIFKAFEKAISAIANINLAELDPAPSKMITTIDLEELIKITACSEHKPVKRTLVDEANQRVLNLITRSTSEQ